MIKEDTMYQAQALAQLLHFQMGSRVDTLVGLVGLCADLAIREIDLGCLGLAELNSSSFLSGAYAGAMFMTCAPYLACFPSYLYYGKTEFINGKFN